jgi:hypothetical protein
MKPYGPPLEHEDMEAMSRFFASVIPFRLRMIPACLTNREVVLIAQNSDTFLLGHFVSSNFGREERLSGSFRLLSSIRWYL